MRISPVFSMACAAAALACACKTKSPKSTHEGGAKPDASKQGVTAQTLHPVSLATRESLRIAVIGDYGAFAREGGGEQAVAGMVAAWKPDLVLTLGDNNYQDGSADTIDANIGKFYAPFIGNYVGSFGSGNKENRFFPTPGNHDWRTPNLAPYLEYFTLPGNERYYDVAVSPLLHLFALDSDPHEPDGNTPDSVQAQWLEQTAGASKACWKFAYFHHAPYSSGDHGPTVAMQWPFGAWGMDAVFGGHDHHYERLTVDGTPYFVNGLGGAEPYEAGERLPTSDVFFNEDWGAQLITVDAQGATIAFHTTGGKVVDSVHLEKSCPNVGQQP